MIGPLVALLLSWIGCSSIVYGQTFLDVFGTENSEELAVIARHRAEILALEDAAVTGMASNKTPIPSERLALHRRREALIHTLCQEGHFQYVDIQIIYYPDLSDRYVTVDVVRESDLSRMTLIPKKETATQYKPKNDVLDEVNRYLKDMFHIFLTEKSWTETSSCAFFHCLPGYSHPALRGRIAGFIRAAQEQKAFIRDTLEHDPIPERRAAAAFLVGYYDSPQDIVKTLLPFVEDSAPLVANNAMRVLGMTVQKAKITGINPAPFIHLLYAPSIIERNKALMMLLQISGTKAVRQELSEKIRFQLVKLLALKQPNNHDFAYALLKRLSSQDYGENNIAAWQKWALQWSTEYRPE